MKYKISVIVPIYNTEKYLSKCLDSLVNQSLKDIEIILINDGSPDNSEKIVKKYVDKYPKKVKYYKKENEGQGIARNYAINLSQGEYITFVDSDDYIDESMLEKLYNKAIKDNADIVSINGFVEIRNGRFINIPFEFNDSNSYKRYILNNSGPCGKIIKKEIITSNNLFFPKLRAYEDISVVPLWGLYSKKISYIEEQLYYYLIHDGSTMKQIEYNDKLTHIYNSLDNLYTRFKVISKDKYYKELEWIYIEHLLHAASLRFFKFNKNEEIKKINKIMKERFPDWNKNKYYKRQSIKYKIVCTLIYKEKFKLLKLILK